MRYRLPTLTVTRAALYARKSTQARDFGTLGSVRGAPGNRRPYRDWLVSCHTLPDENP